MSLQKLAVATFKKQRAAILSPKEPLPKTQAKEGPPVNYAFNKINPKKSTHTLKYLDGKITSHMDKGASKKRNMPDFVDQNRPAKVKEIYRALKRDHPEMSAEMKARIASRQGKPGKQKQGPPYTAPISKHGAYVEDTFQKIAMIKQAGVGSEIGSTMVNPLNWMMGLPAGLAGALFGGRITPEDRESTRNDLWKNLLVPGMGPYRLGKRLHTLVDPY